MNEQILDVLRRDIVASTDKKQFSTPREVTDWINICLSASYSAKAIAENLKIMGWQCTKNPMKRDGKTCRYYHKQLDGDITVWALLDQTADEGQRMDSTPHQELPDADTADDESLSSIDKRFKTARASKEQNLSDIRLVQVTTEQIRSEHIKIQLAKERKEYILVADAVREWNTALNFLKPSLFSLCDKLSTRFASLTDDEQIHSELKEELNQMCNRLADAKDGALGENQDDIYDTQDRIREVETSD